MKQTQKQRMEATFRRMGLQPAGRDRYRGFEIFLGDGFFAEPHVVCRRFGVEKANFPHGAHVGLWFIVKGEDKTHLGNVVFFDKFHDPKLGIIDNPAKRAARVNATRKDAKWHVDQLLKVKTQGQRLHA